MRFEPADRGSGECVVGEAQSVFIGKNIDWVGDKVLDKRDILPLALSHEINHALDFMAQRFPDLQLWAAGFSFGSFIAWSVGVEDPRVCALIAVAPPASKWQFPDALYTSSKPKFIVHGEEDELIPLKAAREFYSRLQEPKEFVVIDRATHLFEGQTSEVGDALEELLVDFSCPTR